jgi:hypothetical protein
VRFLEHVKKSWKTGLGFMLALAFVLVLHGAVPFLAAPTLGQAVWTTGFSQSFANNKIVSIYATNIGIPQPAPIAFGLAGAYPAGLFIATGMHAVDAYTTTTLLWLTLAFWGAWRIAILIGLRTQMALLAAVLWLSMPVIWMHAGYSMVSLGIGLLPFYFLPATILFTRRLESLDAKIRVAGMYFAACLIAVFMDGYSFMMFALGSSLLAAWLFVRFSELRRQLLWYACPIHMVGFGLAYILYSSYIGKPQFEPASLDFFRSWGADITFFAVPSHGIHWLWDTLGLSIRRSSKEFFGDASVWITTFCMPLIIVGLIGWWRNRKQNALATGLLIIAIVGLYMALGPSLKINAIRPPEMIAAGQFIPVMPSELGIGPTGSGWLSETLPGFKNMRAAYRWSALGIFGLWGLAVLLLGRPKGRVNVLGTALVMLLIVSNLPHMGRKWQQDRSYRTQFIQLDKELVADMWRIVGKGELAAFLPYRNDFLVNYLASRTGIRTYNIGGDKNLFEARKHWPYTMWHFKMGTIDANFVDRILMLLARKEANVVILPYIDTLHGAHEWPTSARYREDLQPVIQELSRSGFVDIDSVNYFSAVRIKPEFSDLLQTGQMEQLLLNQGFMTEDSLVSVDKFLPDRIMTQVGHIEKGKLYSNGKSGFLLFGPYSPIRAGDYHLIVRGEVTEGGSGWVDVVSSRGAFSHGKFPLVASKEHSTVLVDKFLTLDQSVGDLEVRIHVEAEDRVCINSYELRPVLEIGKIKEEAP